MIKILLVEKEERRIKDFKKRFKEVFTDNYYLTIAKNVDDVISSLKNNTYDLMLLSYNLEGKITGRFLAEWIKQQRNEIHKGLKFPIFIHSMDAEGAEIMYKILTRGKLLARRVPYLWAKQNFNRYFNLELSDGIN